MSLSTGPHCLAATSFCSCWMETNISVSVSAPIQRCPPCYWHQCSTKSWPQHPKVMSFNSCLTLSPKPCHILPSLSYLILSLLFLGFHPPYHQPLLTCFHVHFQSCSMMTSPRYPKISKHSSALVQKPPYALPPPMPTGD